MEHISKHILIGKTIFSSPLPRPSDSFNINPSSTEPFKGVEDLTYSIKPKYRDKRFLRASVANFLYKLEELSRRVRVTSLKLTPHSRLKPGELGDDFWTFSAEITARRAVEQT